MLLDRVRAKLLGFLSEWNMGCRPRFQALELIQTLRRVVERCREWGLPLFMAKLDFAKACGSLIHSALQSTLEQADCDVENIHAVMRETDGVEVTFQLEGVQSDPVELTNGLQGDPPSPVYFLATTDRVLKPVVAKWDREKVGLHLDGVHMPLVGWMGDLFVLASSPEDLQAMVRQICKACSPTGLELQPTKCQWGTSAPGAEGVSIAVRGTTLFRVPKAEGFQVFGSRLAFDASPNLEYAIRLSKSWKAFWANSALLLSPRVSYFSRVRLFHSVVSPVALYAAPAMYHTCKHMQNLDITQRAVVAKIVT